MKRDSFIFYKSFYESIKELKLEERAKIYDAICQYEFEENEIQINGICKSIFTLIKPQLEANNKRYKNGLKGGRPKTKIKPKDNQNKTKSKPNENENENDNVNDNDNVIKKDKSFINNNIVEIIDYLNQKTNKNFKTTTAKTITCIKARLKEKFTVDDFKKVIDIKTKEWMNTDMEIYLRPETLFGTKFESYLNQKEKKSDYELRQEMYKKLEEKYNEN